VTRWVLALAFGSAVALGAQTGDSQTGLVELHVRPRSASAPAAIRATVTIDRHPDNRALTLAAESADYARRSTVELRGENDARRHSIVFDRLPVGNYEVVAIVRRSGGETIRRSLGVRVYR
jgi:hypothetical protein